MERAHNDKDKKRGDEGGDELSQKLKACQPGSTFCIMMNDDDALTSTATAT